MSGIEYAATITVNPLTALRMVEDFVNLKSGSLTSLGFSAFYCFFNTFLNSPCTKQEIAIVQNGATSIVGQCVIQLARERGIHSINIIRDRC